MKRFLVLFSLATSALPVCASEWTLSRAENSLVFTKQVSEENRDEEQSVSLSKHREQITLSFSDEGSDAEAQITDSKTFQQSVASADSQRIFVAEIIAYIKTKAPDFSAEAEKNVRQFLQPVFLRLPLIGECFKSSPRKGAASGKFLLYFPPTDQAYL